jgi:hypothetical protein
MRHWVAVVSAEQFGTERLYAREQVTVPAGGGTAAEGDPVVLVAAGAPSVLFGHGIVRDNGVDGVLVEYRARLFDDPPPVPADVVPAPATPGLAPLPAAQFTRLSTLVTAASGAGAGRSVWFVSVAVPIEAGTPAEAVREFWTYMDKLGPKELPAYVWPLGDELAMQAFVLGAVTNLDPEEEAED